MKIVHCADLHLDSKMTANLTKEQARERKKEILRTFTRMVEYAAKNGVRAILIAGDLFDTRNISAMARNTVRDMICTHPEIDFLYLRGNHDSDNFLSKMEEIPENLLLFGEEWTAYRYGNVVITGMELNERNQVTAYNSLVLGHDDYNIVTLHGQLGNYRSREQAENISLNDLKNKNIDYLALGHVHGFVQEALDNRGIYCYPGCLEGRGFDECGEKGFVLLDIDEQQHRATTTFVPIAARTLYTLEVDVTGTMTTQEVAGRMEQAIADGQITFFAAKRLNRPVGICSVSSCFSTFCCKRSGIFDDFYVEPAFRHQGVARTLAAAAQEFCRMQGYASVMVGCADCDTELYRALGFETRLGTMLACDL